MHEREENNKTYRKAHHASRQSTPSRDADNGENRCRQDDEAPNELEPHSQPAIRTHRGEVRPQIGIHAPFILQREPGLLAICADGGESAEGLLEMGVDWGARDAIEAFEFARRAQVVFLIDDVDEAEGEDKDEKDRRRGSDDAEGEEGAACVDEELHDTDQGPVLACRCMCNRYALTMLKVRAITSSTR